VRIRSVQGSAVTLERPLGLDVRPQWLPELSPHSPVIEEVGIENLMIEFPPVEYRGHYNEAGHFAIQFTGVYNSCVRNLTVVDADIGVVIGAGGYNTAANVTLKANTRIGAATNRETGHYGTDSGSVVSARTTCSRIVPSRRLSFTTCQSARSRTAMSSPPSRRAPDGSTTMEPRHTRICSRTS